MDSLCTRLACGLDDLPPELVKLILECLRGSAGDLIRTGAVCRSWKILADSIKDKQLQQPIGPFLLFRPVIMNQDVTIYSLYDFYMNRVHRIIIPFVDITRYLIVLSSWNQWILTCTSGHEFDLTYYDDIRFLNLLSGEEIEIPRINHLVKITLSSTTPLDPNCIFMAIFGEGRKLAFYEQGGKTKKWKRLIKRQFGQGYQDVIYFKGEFYAVEDHGNLVVIRDITDKKVKVLKVAPSVITFTSDSLYLVESGGHLFLIIRTYRSKNEDTRKKCEAYKLNLSKGVWEKVRSLGDDNSAYYIGSHLSLSVSPQDFPVRRNCIHYTTLLSEDAEITRLGVFNLTTDQFE